MPVSIKDIYRGTNVRLRNGWKAKMEDNRTRGNTRIATVYGDYTEMGSIFVTDIVEAQMPDGSWEIVKHSPEALKVAAKRHLWGSN